MQFIKVGNYVINLNAIAYVNLGDERGRVRIDMIVPSGNSEEFASESIWFGKEDEINALRSYFSSETNVRDLLL